MEHQLTPAAQRALDEARRWSDPAGADTSQAPALLMGLLAEPECRAAIVLARCGIDAPAVRRQWPGLARRDEPPAEAPRPLPFDLQAALSAAASRLDEYPRPLVLATEHLLLGLAAAEGRLAAWLRQHGLDPDDLEAEIHRLYGHRPGPVPLDDGLPPAAQSSQSSEIRHGTGTGDGVSPQEGSPSPFPRNIGMLRVLDAAANRAREGLRVVEDYARFVLDDRHLTGLVKQLRHDLAEALARVPVDARLAARETRADVGTGLTAAGEQVRAGGSDLLTANFLRVEEALRSLEEIGKLGDPSMAAPLKQLRYRVYTLHRAVQITASSLQRLDRARLYVLIDGRESAEQFEALAGGLVAAGAHAIQLRDKRLDDRTLLARARRLRALTAGTETLCVMNDRADLAALARAHGVHVGQEELTVKDARAIVGPEALVGVSTHTIEQARQAVLDGANYIGVGPTFPSGTKEFAEFPGVELLRQVAAEIRLPAFAIGGITPGTLPEVLSAGFHRIAVSGAVLATDDPPAAVRELLAALGSAEA